MHPEPSTEQQALMTAVRDFLKKEITPERLTEWEKTPGAAEEALRSRVAELGWLGLAAPERAGGMHASFTDLSLLFQECARGLLPLQILNDMRGVQAVTDLDPDCPLLPGLVSGERSIALALDEEFVRDPGRYETRVERDVVSGRKCFVLNGERADYHLVAAREADGLSLVIVAAGDLPTAACRGMADDSQAHVTYEGARIVHRLGEAGAAANAFAGMWVRQQLLALAEMIGGMECAGSLASPSRCSRLSGTRPRTWRRR